MDEKQIEELARKIDEYYSQRVSMSMRIKTPKGFVIDEITEATKDMWTDEDMAMAVRVGQSTAITAAYSIDIDGWIKEYKQSRGKR